MKVRTVLPVVLLLCMISNPSEAQDWASPAIWGDAGNGDSGLETTSRAISVDGRFVAFSSLAPNLATACRR